MRRRRQEKDRRPEQRPHPDLRAGARRTRQTQCRGGAPALHDRVDGLPGQGGSSLLGRRHTARRGRFGRPEIRARSRPCVRPQHQEVYGARHQKHRTRRYGAEGQGRDPGRDRQTRLQDTVRRGLEPRIPEGRRGHQGFHVARPRGRRHRERTGAQADDPPVPSVPDQQFPGAVHGHPLGGNDQIRGQRHAGDPHFVHERDRQSLRPGRGERRNGAQGHRIRCPHRQQVPLPRLRLRRLVLPQGRESPGPYGPGTRLYDAGHRGGGTGQRRAEIHPVRQTATGTGRPARKNHRDMGPRVQARNGRHARSAGTGGDRPVA